MSNFNQFERPHTLVICKFLKDRVFIIVFNESETRYLNFYVYLYPVGRSDVQPDTTLLFVRIPDIR